jgi:mannose-6-phosphate isomerase
MVREPAAKIAAFERWARLQALPLWASRGFDARSDAFEERLGFSLEPVRDAPRRLMVQARQIAVFALAARTGWFPDGTSLALAAGRRMIARYLEADGAPGWVFSVDRAGRPVGRERDLYAHAFALYGLAWLRRLAPEPCFAEAGDATLRYLDAALADPIHGGYWDASPRIDFRRRQNPHMHLMEALLELYEVSREPALLARASAIRALALRRFIDPETAMLREHFEADWRSSPAISSNGPGSCGATKRWPAPGRTPWRIACCRPA